MRFLVKYTECQWGNRSAIFVGQSTELGKPSGLVRIINSQN